MAEPITIDSATRRRIRDAAKRYLTAEVRRLGEAGRLPVPGEESPWIEHDRLWRRRGREASEELAEKLKAWLPTRWTGPDSFPGAREIVEALLRGYVAARTIEQIQYPSPAEHRPAAQLAEFLDLVEHPEQEWRVIRLLQDVDTRQVDGQLIHDARLQPVRGFRETISPLMPEAVAAADRTHVTPGSREPRTLLVRERRGRDGWFVALELRPHLVHASTAIRLVTAGTIVEPLEIHGQPRMVHAGGPSAVTFDPEHRGHWRRVGVVGPSHLAGTEAIAARLCELDTRAEGKIPPAITIALSRFNRSHRAAAWADVLIDITIGLEAALSTGERDEITLRIKSRAANLLARPGDPPGAIFGDVGELLRIRGKVAHGEPIPQKRWEDLFAARGLTHVMVEDRLAVLFDRWRDLLRRAILARLLLDHDGPWRIGSPPAVGVDDALIDPAQRRAWRRAIRRRADELGIAGSIDAPIPLVDYLHDAYSEGYDN